MATPPSSAVQQHATSPPRWTARSLRGSGPDRHVRTPGRGVARQGAPTGGSSCWLVVVGAPPSTTNGLATGASATPRPPSRRVARHEVAPMAPLCPGSRCRGSIAPGRTPPPSTWRSQREDVGVPLSVPVEAQPTKPAPVPARVRVVAAVVVSVMVSAPKAGHVFDAVAVVSLLGTRACRYWHVDGTRPVASLVTGP